MADKGRLILAAMAGAAALFISFGSGLYLRELLELPHSFQRQNMLGPAASSIATAPPKAPTAFEQQTLSVNQAVALWTRNIGITGMLGLILSAIGIALVWRTWKATKDAALATQKTYDAFIKFESPVIIPEFVKRPKPYPQDGKTYISCQLKITNAGRTSAMIEEVRVEGGDPLLYSFISSPSGTNTLAAEPKLEMPSTGKLRGYVQYSSSVEQNVRRLFSIELSEADGLGQEIDIFIRGMLRKGDKRYAEPFN